MLSAPAAQYLETVAELDAFLDEHGLGHLRQVGAEVLLPLLPERDQKSLRYVLSRQRFTDFATAESLRRYGYALAHAPRLREQLPPAALLFLERERDTLARARADVAARLRPPEDPSVHDLFWPLHALRLQHPETLAPRPRHGLPTSWLHPLETIPGFTWVDARPAVGATTQIPVIPAVELELTRVSCSVCPGLCVHTLAAVDTALELLHEPLTPERQQLFDDLRRPAWERTLRAIDRAVQEAERDANGVLVTWRIRVHSDGVEVSPWLLRPTKKSGTRISPSRLREEYDDAVLSSQDRRLAELASKTFAYASRPLLEALAGHPKVFLEDNPSAAVRVELARIGLFADHRGPSVVLVPALDGAPLPPSLVKRLREERPTDPPVFLFEEGARILTVLKLPDEVRRTLEALDRFGNDFPPESHAALVEKLSNLSARIPVAMPRSVMGEEVPPQLTPVLRLQLQAPTAVRVEVCIRPLPESAAFIPGEGARDVHVRRDGKPLHARRDLAREVEVAEALIAQLPLAEAAVEAAFSFVLPDAQRALTFLERIPPLELEWSGERLRVVGRAQSGALKVTLEKRRDWFGVLGGLSVAGERVSLAVLLDAARRQERYVKVQEHTYVEVADALRQQLERLSDHTWRSTHGLEVGPSAVDTLQSLADAGATLDADATWRSLAERIFTAKELSPKVPRTLKATLRDYQREGFAWLTRLASWGAGAVLADDMGLGKTVQALAVLLDRAKLGPALVVAPTSVGFNWVDEAQRFAPGLNLHTYAESSDRGATLEELGPKDVLVVSYGLLTRDAVRLSKIRFATIVFDEAQAVKNAGTQRARAARELQGDFRFALSGTPLENHLGELWSIFRIVFPGLLGSWESFRDRYAMPIEKNLDPTAAPALSRVIQPFLLRRTKGQVAQELPPRTDQRIPVVLSPEEWQLYEDARLAALSDLETPKPVMREQQRRIEVLAALTRLRLLASHPKLYDRRSTVASSKLRRLFELLDELREEGHRALVFSQFTSHLALVRETLDAQGWKYLYLDGRTPRKDRERLVARFQSGEVPLFLISLKAGGFGLNLTGADNVIHLDPWWNPAVEDQASDRAHRIGQHRPVTVYRLVAKGTIEEQILSLHEEKRKLVTNVLEGKDEAARLSTKELIELLSRPVERGPGALH